MLKAPDNIALDKRREELKLQLKCTIAGSAEAKAIQTELASIEEKVKSHHSLTAKNLPKAQVFICYAKEDENIARRLYEELSQSSRIQPWIACENIWPGQNWEFEIQKALRQSRYVLVLLSSHSVSKRGYIRKEIAQALEVLEEFPPSEIYLIPVRLDDIQPSDERLRKIHWVDLWPSSSYQCGLQRLLQVFDKHNAEEERQLVPVKQQDNIIYHQEELPFPLNLSRSPGSTSAPLSSDELHCLWDGILNHLKERRPSLAAILKKGIPVQISQNQMIIGFHPDAAFSRKSLEDPQKIAILAEMIQEFLGRSIKITTTVHNGAMSLETMQRQLDEKAEKQHSSVDHAALLHFWTKILELAKQKRPSLAAVLKKGIPVELNYNQLIVGFHPDAAFSRKTLEDPKKVAVLEEMLQKMFGRSIKIVTTNHDGAMPLEKMRKQIEEHM